MFINEALPVLLEHLPLATREHMWSQPSRSPDVNPINFFLCGNLMENVYLVPSIGAEDTIAHLHAAVGTVNTGMMQNVHEYIVQRATKYVEAG
jgi:hypothetical protein